MSDNPKTPQAGGSYIRKPGGTLEQVGKPTEARHPTGGPRDKDGKPVDLPAGHPELDAPEPAAPASDADPGPRAAKRKD